jgi:hypothetical protein
MHSAPLPIFIEDRIMGQSVEQDMALFALRQKQVAAVCAIAFSMSEADSENDMLVDLAAVERASVLVEDLDTLSGLSEHATRLAVLFDARGNYRAAQCLRAVSAACLAVAEAL